MCLAQVGKVELPLKVQLCLLYSVLRTDAEPDRVHGRQEDKGHDGSPQRPANQRIGERSPEDRMSERNERQDRRQRGQQNRAARCTVASTTAWNGSSPACWL